MSSSVYLEKIHLTNGSGRRTEYIVHILFIDDSFAAVAFRLSLKLGAEVVDVDFPRLHFLGALHAVPTLRSVSFAI